MNRQIFVECRPLVIVYTAFHDVHVDSGNVPTAKEHKGSVQVSVVYQPCLC